jgi:hypothetical protein
VINNYVTEENPVECVFAESVTWKISGPLNYPRVVFVKVFSQDVEIRYLLGAKSVQSWNEGVVGPSHETGKAQT